MRLTALQPLKYGGKFFKRGAEFEAEPKYARTLIALRQAQAGKAELPSAAPKETRTVPAPGAQPPEPLIHEDDEAKASSPKKDKGKYKTRDMRARR